MNRTNTAMGGGPIRVGNREQETTHFRSTKEEVHVLSLEPSFNSFTVWIRGFHNLLREKPSPLSMLLGWSSKLYCFHDDPVHRTEFLGQVNVMFNFSVDKARCHNDALWPWSQQTTHSHENLKSHQKTQNYRILINEEILWK